MSDQVKVTWVPRKYSSRLMVNQMEHYGISGQCLLTDDGIMPGPNRETLCIADRDVEWIVIPQYSTSNLALIASTVLGVQKFYTMNLATGVTTFICDVPVGNTMGYFSQRVSVDSLNYMATGTNVVSLNIGTAAAATVASTAGMYWLKAHLTRLVGLKATNTLAWTVAGTYSDWATTTLGAGSLVVDIANDSLIGLEVIKNQLVILSNKRVIMGYTTGMSLLPYRIEEYLGGDNGDVCAYGASIARFEDTLFYVGRNNIYRLQDGRQVPIGNREIIPQLLGHAAVLMTHTGKIVNPLHHSNGTLLNHLRINEPHYIIVPTSIASSNIDLPVFAYNIYRDAWTLITPKYESVGSLNNYPTAFHDDYFNESRGIHYLNKNKRTIHRLSKVVTSAAFDNACAIQTPPMLVGEADRDYTLTRALVKYTLKLNGNPTAPAVSFSGSVKQSGTTVTFTPSQVFLSDQEGPDQMWLDLLYARATGQYFSLTMNLVVNPPIELVITEVTFFFTEAGEFRGY
jgi:hypothetical protein